MLYDLGEKLEQCEAEPAVREAKEPNDNRIDDCLPVVVLEFTLHLHHRRQSETLVFAKLGLLQQDREDLVAEKVLLESVGVFTEIAAEQTLF